MKTNKISYRGVFLILTLIAALLAGCGSSKLASSEKPAAPESRSSSASDRNVNTDSGAAQSQGGDNAPASNNEKYYGTDQLSGDARASQERIVIKNATMSITVKDAVKKIEEISKTAEELGGWVVSSSTNSYPAGGDLNLTYGSITVRVPADHLEELIQRAREGVISVGTQNITGQDVTSEYTDLQSQLRNLEAAEAQLQSIMSAAKKTEDVMMVFNQLVQIRSNIEVTRGRIKYYTESAAYSSLSVDVAPQMPAPSQTRSAWRPGSTVDDAYEALVEGFRFLVDAVIWLVIAVLPFALFVAAVIWGIYRVFKRLRTRRQTSA